ncbi:MAG: FAD-dependent oxidoreductase [Deltaproteobacteria bacterium]|nr:FAD-dependent oxidoreductase [Deltaproteobacteria bacterium]
MRTRVFSAVARALRLAQWCGEKHLPTREGVERARAEEGLVLKRRALLLGAGAAGAGALAGCAEGVGAGASGVRALSADVAVVGAGLAGLGCARDLERYGVTVSLYEGADRVGGRCWSLGGAFPGPVEFPGQVAERGGELIDTTHGTMRAWANEFNLPLENLHREPGELAYYFNGAHHTEAAVVEEFRVFVDRMRDDLRTVGEPTAASFTPQDALLDRMTLREYLSSRGAGTLAAKAIDEAYTAEYGVESDRQSCLAFLLFIHADRRGRFQPFGVFSDEKFHVSTGNEGIVRGLHGSLSRPAELGHRLVRARKTSSGRVELTFQRGSRTVVRTHDAVVLTLPFSTLRLVDLDPSLGLPPWKTRVIQEFLQGTNAKQMVGFSSRPWAAQGSNGASYSDLENHQATWETNAINATATRAILTDYASGDRGARLDPSRSQTECERFLADLDRVYPGARAAATRDRRGNVLSHLEHWPSNPMALGSYAANAPGYFTTLADLEGVPVGNVFFAGEHTSSFYEWQGFMEGAALSGLRAAAEVRAAFAR